MKKSDDTRHASVAIMSIAHRSRQSSRSGTSGSSSIAAAAFGKENDDTRSIIMNISEVN